MSLRKWIFAVSLVSATPALSADQSAQLPAFEFKGIRADQIIEKPREAGLNGCSKNGVDWTCITSSPLAGSWSVSTYQFISGYLRTLNVSAPRSNYEGLQTAFEAKYGKPCQTVQSKWQNRAGASLDNTETTWCFSTGKLTLYAIGDRITNSQAIYADVSLLKENQKPIVDF